MKPFHITTLAACLLGAGCAISIPSGVQPVKDFDINRYQGKWYEIARLDHSFERGLDNVSATYTLRKDGGVDVLNRGYDRQKERWKEARGRAYFVDQPTVGRLKVSFFRPFYGAYNVIALDRDEYRYAMVCGPDRSYLWILAREKQLSESKLDELLEQAKELGFDTEALIFVEHDRENNDSTHHPLDDRTVIQ